MSRLPVVDLEGPRNSDWIQASAWDLPPYKSDAFMTWLRSERMTLEHFRQLPVYQGAVKRGEIADDEWVGERGGA